MKCNAFIIERKTKKKNYWHALEYQNDKEELGAIKCDGDIVISNLRIEISDGCSCCGSSELVIYYKCSKCDRKYFFELPQNIDEIKNFLNDSLSKLTDEDHQKMLDIRQEEKIKQDKVYKELMEKGLKIIEGKK